MTKSLIRAPSISSLITITTAVTAVTTHKQRAFWKLFQVVQSIPLDRHIKYVIYPHWIGRKNGTSWQKQLCSFGEGLPNWIIWFYLLNHWMNKMLQSRKLCQTQMMNSNSVTSWNTDRCITLHCFIQKIEG